MTSTGKSVAEDDVNGGFEGYNEYEDEDGDEYEYGSGDEDEGGDADGDQSADGDEVADEDEDEDDVPDSDSKASSVASTAPTAASVANDERGFPNATSEPINIPGANTRVNLPAGGPRDVPVIVGSPPAHVEHPGWGGRELWDRLDR